MGQGERGLPFLLIRLILSSVHECFAGYMCKQAPHECLVPPHLLELEFPMILSHCVDAGTQAQLVCKNSVMICIFRPMEWHY